MSQEDNEQKYAHLTAASPRPVTIELDCFIADQTVGVAEELLLHENAASSAGNFRNAKLKIDGEDIYIVLPTSKPGENVREGSTIKRCDVVSIAASEIGREKRIWGATWMSVIIGVSGGVFGWNSFGYLICNFREVRR